MSKYIAHYKDAAQISPDGDFEVFTEMLACDENTTLKEIMDWMLKNNKDLRCFTVTKPEESKGGKG